MRTRRTLKCRRCSALIPDPLRGMQCLACFTKDAARMAAAMGEAAAANVEMLLCQEPECARIALNRARYFGKWAWRYAQEVESGIPHYDRPEVRS